MEFASTIFRDFVTDGVPASGANKPQKSKIRAWGSWLEGLFAGGTAVANVTTLAALKAVDTASFKKAFYDGSMWDFYAGDYSAQVTLDTLSGIYVKADDTATTAGAWKRRFTGRADVAWWLQGGMSLTAPLAAALAMGFPLWLGAGSYTTSNVAFPSNSNLLMDRNAVIAPTPGFTAGDIFTASAKDNIWIEGGQFNAPYATYTGIAYIRPTNCSRVTVKNVKVISVGTHGILLDGCTQSLVEDCEILEAGIIGILLNSASAVSTANRVVRCRSLNSYGSHCIQLAGGKYNLAIDCYSFGAYNFGLSLYQETYSRAVNCTSRRSRVEGFNLDSCARSSFVNCTVDWDGTGGNASVDFGMSINGDTVDTSFNAIIGCKVKGCGKSGIAIAGATNAQFNLIADNTITNVNSLAEANKAGVLIYGGGAVNNHVVGNQILGDANMHYGVRDESTGRNVFGTNNIMNAATGDYSLNSSSVESVTKAGTETLSNKTLTAPLINNATVTGLTSYAVAGMISGLVLSNNGADAVNDIDVAIGSASSIDTVPVLMTLATAITKRLDANWVVGNNQGGLDTGTIANGTYHVFLIRRPDTGVVDVIFSANSAGPTMPTNYTQKRRIGSILREAGSIVAFRQVGNIFKRTTAATDRNTTAAQASTLWGLSVPGGLTCQPIMKVALAVGLSTTCTVAIGDAAAGSANTNIAAALTGAGDTSDTTEYLVPALFSTNTSAQIYFAQTNTAGTPTSSTLQTLGWVDTRGQG